MAQRLLRFSAMRLLAGIGLLSLGSGACVVPIPAEVESADGGPNSSPAILHPVPDMPFGLGTVPLLVSDYPSVSFDVRDLDVDDPMEVRVFGNFQLGGPNHREILTEPVLGGVVIRPVVIETASWCRDLAGVSNVVFDVVVADRGFDKTQGADPRATVGNLAIRSWVMDCP